MIPTNDPDLATEIPADGVIRRSDATSLDAQFRALADPTRRCVLYYLARRDALPVTQLAASVAASATDASADAGTPERPARSTTPDADADVPERTLTALHHVHLPALERAGLITRDGDRVSLADGSTGHALLAVAADAELGGR